MFSSLYYSIYFIILLAIEIVIALFLYDTIIRPFVGDVLAVILVYCFLSIFLKEKNCSIAMLAFLIAVFLETLQYAFHHQLDALPHFLRIILGSTFDRWDIAMYFLGFLACLILKK